MTREIYLIVADSGGDELHSIFATAFLNALKENNDILDGADLFNKLRRPVMLNSAQTSEYSDIRKAGHEGGEFLFIRFRSKRRLQIDHEYACRRSDL